MKLIVGSPAAVRSGAERLADTGRELTQAGAGVAGAAAQARSGWSGPAAVAFLGAAQRAEGACRSTGAGLAELADAGRRYADHLQSAQDELARLARQEARLGEQELALRVKSVAVGTLPGQAAGVTAELADVTANRDRVRGAALEVVRRHDLDRAAFVARLTTAPAPTAVQQVTGIAPATWAAAKEWAGKGKEAKKEYGRVRRVIDAFRSQATIREISRMPMPLDEATAARLASAESSLQAASKTFTESSARGSSLLGGHAADLKIAGGRLSLVMTAWEGIGDAVKGDPDHPGLRDVSTRVAGAGGAVGAGVLLVSAANPVGMTLVTAYGVYKLGTWAYDHRDDIKRIATQAWRKAAPVARAGAEAAGRAVEGARQRLGDAGTAVRQGIDGVREGVGAGVRRMLPAPRFGW